MYIKKIFFLWIIALTSWFLSLIVTGLELGWKTSRLDFQLQMIMTIMLLGFTYWAMNQKMSEKTIKILSVAAIATSATYLTHFFFSGFIASLMSFTGSWGMLVVAATAIIMHRKEEKLNQQTP